MALEPSADDLAGLPPVLQLADWRQRVFALYAEVRAAAVSETEVAWQHWVSTRERLYRTHPQSPLTPAARAVGRLPLHFPYDPAWRLTIAVREVASGRSGDVSDRSVDVGQDGRLAMSPVLMTDGLEKAIGCELTLFALRGYGGGLFLPFRDATSGTTTYGGGRYLLDTIKGADLGTRHGQVLLDFNFAYHPSCCHDSQWTCPLSPPENRTAVAIEAGERL